MLRFFIKPNVLQTLTVWQLWDVLFCNHWKYMIKYHSTYMFHLFYFPFGSKLNKKLIVKMENFRIVQFCVFLNFFSNDFSQIIYTTKLFVFIQKKKKKKEFRKSFQNDKLSISQIKITNKLFLYFYCSYNIK